MCIRDRKDNLAINAIELIRNIFNPNKVVVLKSDNNDKDFAALLSFTNDMNLKENNTTFYVCRDYKCNQPVNTIEELEKLLLQ